MKPVERVDIMEKLWEKNIRKSIEAFSLEGDSR